MRWSGANMTIPCATWPGSLAGNGELTGQSPRALSYRLLGMALIRHNPDRPPIQDLDALPFVSEVYKRHLRDRGLFLLHRPLPGGDPRHRPGLPLPLHLLPLAPDHHRPPVSASAVSTTSPTSSSTLPASFPRCKEVFIEDDTLTAGPGACAGPGRGTDPAGNRLPFSANARAKVSYETLVWLKKAGLRLLCVGFESGDQAVLDAMRKGIRVEQFFRFREDARRAGVLIHGCFMAGGPGETRESLARRWNWPRPWTRTPPSSFP